MTVFLKQYLVLGIIFFLNTAIALDDFDLRWFGEEDTITTERDYFSVQFIWYSDQLELNTAYEMFNGVNLTDGSNIRGFAVIHDNTDLCAIHVIKPKIWDDREAMIIIGHELMHCTYADHNSYDFSKKSSTSNEELYAKDRRLELEWLRKEYIKMGTEIGH